MCTTTLAPVWTPGATNPSKNLTCQLQSSRAGARLLFLVTSGSCMGTHVWPCKQEKQELPVQGQGRPVNVLLAHLALALEASHALSMRRHMI